MTDPTSYTPVRRGTDVGSLTLDAEQLCWKPTGKNAKDLTPTTIPWNTVSKHMANPPKIAKALLKIVSSSETVTFQTKNRDILDKLKADVDQRRKDCTSSDVKAEAAPAVKAATDTADKAAIDTADKAATDKADIGNASTGDAAADVATDEETPQESNNETKAADAVIAADAGNASTEEEDAVVTDGKTPQESDSAKAEEAAVTTADTGNGTTGEDAAPTDEKISQESSTSKAAAAVSTADIDNMSTKGGAVTEKDATTTNETMPQESSSDAVATIDAGNVITVTDETPTPPQESSSDLAEAEATADAYGGSTEEEDATDETMPQESSNDAAVAVATADAGNAITVEDATTDENPPQESSSDPTEAVATTDTDNASTVEDVATDEKTSQEFISETKAAAEATADTGNASPMENAATHEKASKESSNDTTAAPATTYLNVLLLSNPGTVTLLEENLTYQPDSKGNTLAIGWDTVTKHQASPAKVAKAMMKIMLTSGKNHTFQLADRKELLRLKKDIASRLESFQQQPGPSASVSGSEPKEEKAEGSAKKDVATDEKIPQESRNETKAAAEATADTGNASPEEDVTSQESSSVWTAAVATADVGNDLSLKEDVATDDKMSQEPSNETKGAAVTTADTGDSSPKVDVAANDKTLQEPSSAKAAPAATADAVNASPMEDAATHEKASKESSNDTSAAPATTYLNVLLLSHPGTVTLSAENLNYQPDSKGNTLAIGWDTVTKHQASPAKVAKAMMKIVLTSGKNHTFQLADRKELLRLKKDITSRLESFQQQPGPSASDAEPTVAEAKETKKVASAEKDDQSQSTVTEPSTQTEPGGSARDVNDEKPNQVVEEGEGKSNRIEEEEGQSSTRDAGQAAGGDEKQLPGQTSGAGDDSVSNERDEEDGSSSLSSGEKSREAAAEAANEEEETLVVDPTAIEEQDAQMDEANGQTITSNADTGTDTGDGVPENDAKVDASEEAIQMMIDDDGAMSDADAMISGWEEDPVDVKEGSFNDSVENFDVTEEIPPEEYYDEGDEEFAEDEEYPEDGEMDDPGSFDEPEDIIEGEGEFDDDDEANTSSLLGGDDSGEEESDVEDYDVLEGKAIKDEEDDPNDIGDPMHYMDRLGIQYDDDEHVVPVGGDDLFFDDSSHGTSDSDQEESAMSRLKGRPSLPPVVIEERKGGVDDESEEDAGSDVDQSEDENSDEGGDSRSSGAASFASDSHSGSGSDSGSDSASELDSEEDSEATSDDEDSDEEEDEEEEVPEYHDPASAWLTFSETQDEDVLPEADVRILKEKGKKKKKKKKKRDDSEREDDEEYYSDEKEQYSDEEEYYSDENDETEESEGSMEFELDVEDLSVHELESALIKKLQSEVGGKDSLDSQRAVNQMLASLREDLLNGVAHTKTSRRSQTGMPEDFYDWAKQTARTVIDRDGVSPQNLDDGKLPFLDPELFFDWGEFAKEQKSGDQPPNDHETVEIKPPSEPASEAAPEETSPVSNDDKQPQNGAATPQEPAETIAGPSDLLEPHDDVLVDRWTLRPVTDDPETRLFNWKGFTNARRKSSLATTPQAPSFDWKKHSKEQRKLAKKAAKAKDSSADGEEKKADEEQQPPKGVAGKLTGIDLLKMLVVANDDSGRAAILAKHIAPPASPDQTDGLVSPKELLAAIAKFVDTVRTVKKSDNAPEITSARQVAIAARLSIIELYGDNSEILREFEMGLAPAFAPKFAD